MAPDGIHVAGATAVPREVADRPRLPGLLGAEERIREDPAGDGDALLLRAGARDVAAAALGQRGDQPLRRAQPGPGLVAMLRKSSAATAQAAARSA